MELRQKIVRRLAAGILVAGVALAVSRLFAAPATQPMATAHAATTQPAVGQTSRDSSRSNRESRYSRDRRSSRSSSSYVPAVPGDPLGVLKTRSIFVKGNQSVSGSSPTTHPGGFSSGNGLAPKAPAQLVFNGVTFIDGEGCAFIEDLGADRVSTAKVGDGIAGGRVTGITFDTLTYAANGKSMNISLGQNLEGNYSSGGSSSVSTTTPPPGSTTLPFGQGYIGVGASNGSTAGMSSEDILARMKAKRQAELQGK